MALEIVDIGVLIGYLIVIFAGAAFGGFLANIVYGYFGFFNLQSRLLSLENSLRGNKGVAVRQEKTERMAAAVAEGAGMLKAGKKPVEVMTALAPKYPDVAMDLLKKYGGGLGGLLK